MLDSSYSNYQLRVLETSVHFHHYFQYTIHVASRHKTPDKSLGCQNSLVSVADHHQESQDSVPVQS